MKYFLQKMKGLVMMNTLINWAVVEWLKTSDFDSDRGL